MPQNDDTENLIDFLLVKLGSTEAVARSRCLSWLQQAENEICGMRNWWFLSESASLAFQAGTHVYSVESGTAAILSLSDASGNPMQQVPWDTWRYIFAPDSNTGSASPTNWSLRPRDAVTQVLSIEVWPTPTAGSTGLLERLLGPATLVDIAANFSRLPADSRSALVLRALELMAQNEEKIDLDQATKNDRQALMAALLAKDQQQRKGIPWE